MFLKVVARACFFCLRHRSRDLGRLKQRAFKSRQDFGLNFYTMCGPMRRWRCEHTRSVPEGNVSLARCPKPTRNALRLNKPKRHSRQNNSRVKGASDSHRQVAARRGQFVGSPIVNSTLARMLDGQTETYPIPPGVTSTNRSIASSDARMRGGSTPWKYCSRQ